MKKLTKEQAQSLIESLDKRKFEDSGLQVDDNYELPVRVLKHVINQCTEKEFPEYDGTWSCPGGQGVLQLRTCFNKRYIFIKQDDKYQLSMEQHEFKQFTEGCNKIVEYLNEKVD